MAWQEDSRDAPAEAPVGFAMPSRTALDDLVYAASRPAQAPPVPAPAGFAPPAAATPALSALAPAPGSFRDPSQPFLADRDDGGPATAGWDPRQPLSLNADTTHPDDLPTAGDDGHPDFPPPSGRPVAPAMAAPPWQPGPYPPPAGAPWASPPAAPWATAPSLPAYAPNPVTIARSGPAVPAPADPYQAMHQGFPAARPGPPGPADPYQTMRQPFPQARPGAPWAGPTPAPQYVYRPPIVTPKPVTLNVAMLIALGFGTVLWPVSWLLFLVAWLLGNGLGGMRPAVSLGYRIAAPAILFVWVLSLFQVTLFPTLVNPLYATLSQFACAIMIVVTLTDYGLARSRLR